VLWILATWTIVDRARQMMEFSLNVFIREQSGALSSVRSDFWIVKKSLYASASTPGLRKAQMQRAINKTSVCTHPIPENKLQQLHKKYFSLPCKLNETNVTCRDCNP
jgi:hypothetical protein